MRRGEHVRVASRGADELAVVHVVAVEKLGLVDPRLRAGSGPRGGEVCIARILLPVYRATTHDVALLLRQSRQAESVIERPSQPFSFSECTYPHLDKVGRVQGRLQPQPLRVVDVGEEELVGDADGALSIGQQRHDGAAVGLVALLQDDRGVEAQGGDGVGDGLERGRADDSGDGGGGDVEVGRAVVGDQGDIEPELVSYG